MPTARQPRSRASRSAFASSPAIHGQFRPVRPPDQWMMSICALMTASVCGGGARQPAMRRNTVKPGLVNLRRDLVMDTVPGRNENGGESAPEQFEQASRALLSTRRLPCSMGRWRPSSHGFSPFGAWLAWAYPCTALVRQRKAAHGRAKACIRMGGDGSQQQRRTGLFACIEQAAQGRGVGNRVVVAQEQPRALCPPLAKFQAPPRGQYPAFTSLSPPARASMTSRRRIAAAAPDRSPSTNSFAPRPRRIRRSVSVIIDRRHCA